MHTIDWLDQRCELLMQMLYSVSIYLEDTQDERTEHREQLGKVALLVTDELFQLDERYVSEAANGGWEMHETRSQATESTR